MFRYGSRFLIAASLALSCIIQSSFADEGFETVRLPHSDFNLRPGETESIRLDSWRHIRKIYVQAQGWSCDSTIEVMTNGETKGTIYLPGRDPSYVVTIAEAVDSIEFRHVAGCGGRILEVKAVQSKGFVSGYSSYREHGGAGHHIGRGAYGNEISQIADSAIKVSEALRDALLPDEWKTYILPIKKMGARLYVQSAARGELSEKTRVAMAALKAQIDLASEFLDKNLERNTTFDLSVELLRISTRLDDLLN